MAGHLKYRALQEWNLLEADEKASYSRAVEVLCLSRLVCCNRALSAQDFMHAAQHEAEPIADFIMRLERTFRTACGQEQMSLETKGMLLYGKLQEGMHAFAANDGHRSVWS